MRPRWGARWSAVGADVWRDLETLMSLAEKVDDITYNPNRNRPPATVPRPPSRAP